MAENALNVVPFAEAVLDAMTRQWEEEHRQEQQKEERRKRRLRTSATGKRNR